MKKILLSLGAAASIIAPVATVVACGDPNTPDTPITGVVDVNQGTKVFANSNTATNEELNKGINTKLNVDPSTEGPLLKIGDISLNNPVGPKSGIAHNYSGAVGILNTTYTDMLGNPASAPADATPEGQTIIVVENLLKELLSRKDILTNNNTQNLNTQATAQRVYDVLKGLGTEKLSKDLAATKLGLTAEKGAKDVMFAVDGSQAVTITLATPAAGTVDTNQGTKAFKASNTVEVAELTKGITPYLAQGMTTGPIIKVGDVSRNFPVGPKSGMKFNYSGAVGILNATYTDMLKNPATKPVATTKEGKTLIVVENLLRELLLRKDVLTNNNTQNLNTKATAQALYNKLWGMGVDKLSQVIAVTDTGLTQAKTNKKVMFAVSADQKVTLTFA